VGRIREVVVTPAIRGLGCHGEGLTREAVLARVSSLSTLAIGRRVYSLGVVWLGAIELFYGSLSSDWLPVSSHLAGYKIVAYAAAGALVLGGVAMNIGRAAWIGALGLAALFALSVLLYAPFVIKGPTDIGVWEAVAESAAMAAGGALAYALAPGVRAGRAATARRIARLVLGVCLLIFGAAHFAFAKYTASLVPAWLPPSQLFWTYATGAAQIAAGLAMLSGLQVRLAAILLTTMYVIFSLLVHIPMLLATPTVRFEWTENAVNLILIGVAWTMADSLAGRGSISPAAKKP
jgi:uncharacterized membrane protein YphA (DoxX/SURF4 family)